MFSICGTEFSKYHASQKVPPLAWVMRLNEFPRDLLELVMYHIQPKIRSNFWQFNFAKSETNEVCRAQGFWKSVVLSWSEYNFPEPKDIHDILNQYICCNLYIMVNKKPIIATNLTGIIDTILDLVNKTTGKLYTYAEFVSHYGDRIDYLRYFQIISAIPKSWKESIKMLKPSILEISYCDNFQ